MAQAATKPQASVSGVSQYDIRQFDKARKKQLDPLTRDKGNEEMGALHERLDTRRETAWRSSAIAETVSLNAARGDEIARFQIAPGETDKPLRRLSGLDWLWAKGRLETHQMAAGLKYGDDYRLATDVSLKSCMADGTGGGGGKTSQEVRREAQDRLRDARRALVGHAGMTDLCDRVAGEGSRVRTIANDNDGLAQNMEGKLSVALDLLAVHYGIAS